MPFVLDASVAACWAMPDEHHAIALAARSLMNDGDSAVAPSLWWYETRNTLIVNERRGRISGPQILEALGLFAQSPVALDHTPHEMNLLTLARSYRLSVYDAAYLELAQRLRAPLATLDTNLANAAHAEAIALLS